MKLASIETPNFYHDVYIGDIVEYSSGNSNTNVGVVITAVKTNVGWQLAVTEDGSTYKVVDFRNFHRRIKDNQLMMYNCQSTHVYIQMYENVGNDHQDVYQLAPKKVLVNNPYSSHNLLN